jgi:hypothetical protein
MYLSIMKLSLTFISLIVIVDQTLGFSPGLLSAGRRITQLLSTTTSFSTTTALEGDLNTQSLLADSTFSIKPDDLIARAKQVLGKEIGLGLKDGGECLAESFAFCAPVVGPIDRDAFIQALTSFDLETAFDLEQQYFGWNVDPLQPNRVWYFNRQKATHVNTFQGVEATGKKLELPPQCYHMDFEESGKVTEFGFYTVDRQQGNTGGLGGAFAFFYGVGKPLPFPEGRPYQMSWQRKFFTAFINVLQKFKKD